MVEAPCPPRRNATFASSQKTSHADSLAHNPRDAPGVVDDKSVNLVKVDAAKKSGGAWSAASTTAPPDDAGGKVQRAEIRIDNMAYIGGSAQTRNDAARVGA